MARRKNASSLLGGTSSARGSQTRVCVVPVTLDEGRKRERKKKIISTGSLLADPISGSTADGRRCLRLDRIAFLAVAY